MAAKPVVVRDAFSVSDRSSDLVTPADAVGAKQSFKAECDINNIVRRFSDTGEFSHLALSSPSFGDVTGLEFREMMQFVATARESFEALPADVRKRFANDPGQFVDFVQDPQNGEELIRMGLAVASKVVEAVPPVPPRGVSAPESPPSVGGAVPAAPAAP